MAFYNPYHFVPVRKVDKGNNILKNGQNGKFEFGTHPNVMHDRYIDIIGEENFFSGRIICRLTAETAFVVGDKHEPPTEEGKLPTTVKQYEINGEPAVPASTLRGLISSIAETAGNSSLRVLENETYSYRKKAEEALQDVGMVIKKGEDDYWLISLSYFEFNKKQFVMESINCIKVELTNPDKYETFTLENKKFYYLKAELVNKTIEQPISEEVYRRLSVQEQKKYERGFLRIMRNSARDEDFKDLNRKNELFIYWSEDDGDIEKSANLRMILPEAVKRFHKLADLRTEDDKKYPFEPIGAKRNNGDYGDKVRLKTGDLVYFRPAKSNGKKVATEISFSAIWRDLVGQEDSTTKVKKEDTTFDFFRKIDSELLPFNKDRKQITLAEQMFGFVENNGNEKNPDGESSLAGRIYPSAARIVKRDDGNYYEEETLLKILASPKPPSPALYFKGNNSTYIAKNQLNSESHQPQGRKFYLHNNTNEGRPWKTNLTGEKLEKVKNQMMTVTPVKKDSVFYFHIDFENFSETELGALLYALRPNDEFRHKLGLGKPIGLGTVRIDIAGMFLIDRKKRYSREGLFAPRYHNVWKDENIELPVQYSDEFGSDVTESVSLINDLKAKFRENNPQICDILETIGNPKNVNADNKVHYPKISDKSDEDENFLWFVANDAIPDKKGVRKIKVDKREFQIEGNNFSLKPISKDTVTPLEDIPLK